MRTDVIIAGCGVAGLLCALTLPEEKNITVITKAKAEESDSFLAQGGICVLPEDDDFDSFFEDTLRAGHYENDKLSVEIMIRHSRKIIDMLVTYGVDFEKNENGFIYTREGAHSRPRILFHQDQTGKEITSNLLRHARERKNIKIIEECTMVDIISVNNVCHGIIAVMDNGIFPIYADYTVFATGGIGGLYQHSTNFPHLKGDALAIALKHGIRTKDIDYIQIHPTTLFTKSSGRSFLISESVRGEGAILLDKNGERFVNELLPRDTVAQAIYKQMEKDGTDHVMLSFAPISRDEILTHFPNIYTHCLQEGYDVTKEPIPVVPAQHYYMGGIWVDKVSKTSLDRLYAVGETACNGVHGKNRLASNSLLESLVFAHIAANDISENYTALDSVEADISPDDYIGFEDRYKSIILNAIEKEKNNHE